MFVIKANTRIDTILRITLQMLKIFFKNRTNIVIILTFSETLNEKQKKEIKSNLCQKYKIDENVIIFSGKNVKGDDLLKDLNNIKKNLLNINELNINEKKLLNSELSEETIEFKDNKLEQFKKALENFIATLNRSNLQPPHKEAIFFTFKYYLSQLIKSFREKLVKRIPDIITINAETIIFSNELFEQLNNTYSNKFDIQSLTQNQIHYESCIYGQYNNESQIGLNNTKGTIKVNYIYGIFGSFAVIIDLMNFEIQIKNQRNTINKNECISQKKNSNSKKNDILDFLL